MDAPVGKSNAILPFLGLPMRRRAARARAWLGERRTKQAKPWLGAEPEASGFGNGLIIFCQIGQDFFGQVCWTIKELYYDFASWVYCFRVRVYGPAQRVLYLLIHSSFGKAGRFCSP